MIWIETISAEHKAHLHRYDVRLDFGIASDNKTALTAMAKAIQAHGPALPGQNRMRTLAEFVAIMMPGFSDDQVQTILAAATAERLKR